MTNIAIFLFPITELGFQQEHENKIFQVFQRLYFKDEFKGTGIGLAIIKKINRNYNGFINAEGKIGKGVTFNIYIPHSD